MPANEPPNIRSNALPTPANNQRGPSRRHQRESIHLNIPPMSLPAILDTCTPLPDVLAGSMRDQELTPARALVAEMVRRYWVLDIDCTNLEVQQIC